MLGINTCQGNEKTIGIDVCLTSTRNIKKKNLWFVKKLILKPIYTAVDIQDTEIG